MLRGPQLIPLLLVALAATAQAQEGDYRVEGRDSAGWSYEAALHVSRDARGGLVVERTGTYPEREGKDAIPFVWRSHLIDEISPSSFVVQFRQQGHGLCGALEDPGDEGDLIRARYRIYPSGSIREWLSAPVPTGRSEWTWAFASGGRDFPTLELVREARLESLMGDSIGRYEASGITFADDMLITVFDNSTRVGLIPVSLDPDETDVERTRGRGDSNFEGLTWDSVRGRFYGVVEAEEAPDGALRGRVWELDADLERRDREWLDEHELRDAGKGFEGLAHLHHDGEEYLLGLLEGNHGRGGRRGRERGHGRIKVFERGNGGSWTKTVTVRLPESAKFSDYSGIDINGTRVAVVSQESSLLWVGELDPDAWTLSEGTVYRFPREGSQILYGSIEGVAWIGDDRLAFVSDRLDEGCEQKGESIHVFSLP